jgi:hypothetical protein
MCAHKKLTTLRYEERMVKKTCALVVYCGNMDMLLAFVGNIPPGYGSVLGQSDLD